MSDLEQEIAENEQFDDVKLTTAEVGVIYRYMSGLNPNTSVKMIMDVMEETLAKRAKENEILALLLEETAKNLRKNGLDSLKRTL